MDYFYLYIGLFLSFLMTSQNLELKRILEII